MSGFWYLASPYSHPDPAERHRRYVAAEDALAWLTVQRRWAFAPIVHSHNMAVRCDLPLDAALWQAFNHAMIVRSNGIIVLEIDGWKESKGVAEEIGFCLSLGLPLRSLQVVGAGNFRFVDARYAIADDGRSARL